MSTKRQLEATGPKSLQSLAQTSVDAQMRERELQRLERQLSRAWGHFVRRQLRHQERRKQVILATGATVNKYHDKLRHYSNLDHNDEQRKYAPLLCVAQLCVALQYDMRLQYGKRL